MKKIVFLTVIITLVIGIFVGCMGNGMDEKITILAVNDIKDDPMAFTGIITINGIVTEFSKENSALFGIEDKTGTKSCCPNFVLYVNYDGDMPKLNDEVYITGSWLNDKTQNGEPIFGVTEIEVVK